MRTNVPEQPLSPEAQARIQCKVDARVREITHQAQLEQIRKDGRARVAKILADAAAQRRADERAKIADVTGAMQTYRQIRETYGTSRAPFDVARRFHLYRTSDIVHGCTEADVERWRQHVNELARDLGVSVDYVVTHNVNAYALVPLRRIEVGEICTVVAYVAGLHELGHVKHPCESGHLRVPTKKDRTCCIRCELSAWRFAAWHARPTWTRAMHDVLVDSLRTYCQYATAAETVEINDLMSRRGLRELQLERIQRECQGRN